MRKKRKIFTRMLIALIVLIIVTTVIIVIKKDWFLETVPDNCESGTIKTRTEEDIYEETYTTGIKRYREGDFVSAGGSYYYLREGVLLESSIDVTIKKGSFKIAIYDLGKDYKLHVVPVDQNLSEDKKVYEEEFTESGTYQLDCSMLQPDTTYLIAEMAPMGDGLAYSYHQTDRIYVKRWQYLYDYYIGSLPFCNPKYGGNVE